MQPVPAATNIAKYSEGLTERLTSESHCVSAIMGGDASQAHANTTYQHCFVPFGGGGGMLEALQSNVLIAASGTPVDTAAELESVNQQMSTYISTSELSQLNQATTVDKVVVSDYLFEVLQISQSVGAASEGALDVTISPLVDLWGFGSEYTLEPQVPSAAEIAQASRL